MGQMVVTGASATCTFGAAPTVLSVTSQSVCLADSRPAATIQDCQTANLPTFGMCSSLGNPQVAAATSLAGGTLTPQPCTMVPAGTWIPTKPTVLINGKPCLTSDCKLMCSYGGVIGITSPGQVKATVT